MNQEVKIRKGFARIISNWQRQVRYGVKVNLQGLYLLKLYKIGSDMLFRHFNELSHDHMTEIFMGMSYLTSADRVLLQAQHYADIDKFIFRMKRPNHVNNRYIIRFIKSLFTPIYIKKQFCYNLTKLFLAGIHDDDRCFCKPCKVFIFDVLQIVCSSIFEPWFVNRIISDPECNIIFDILKFFTVYFVKNDIYLVKDEMILFQLLRELFFVVNGGMFLESQQNFDSLALLVDAFLIFTMKFYKHVRFFILYGDIMSKYISLFYAILRHIFSEKVSSRVNLRYVIGGMESRIFKILFDSTFQNKPQSLNIDLALIYRFFLQKRLVVVGEIKANIIMNYYTCHVYKCFDCMTFVILDYFSFWVLYPQILVHFFHEPYLVLTPELVKGWFLELARFMVNFIPLNVFHFDLQNNYSTLFTFFCILTSYFGTLCGDVMVFNYKQKALLNELSNMVFYYVDISFSHHITYYSAMILFLVLEFLKNNNRPTELFRIQCDIKIFIGAYLDHAVYDDTRLFKILSKIFKSEDVSKIKNRWKLDLSTADNPCIMEYIMDLMEKLPKLSIDITPQIEELYEKTLLVITLAQKAFESQP
ncbi:hypothetical protein RF11_00374 [Thelohanellus kitauei]|uniref:Uncharacterized protein n=1 Tax=Thelohanellus kitauei TaxID=669202 RepID=A0A0C2JNZ8_THEKT|nr:hypothetical protein RF11_00374 [Thelohanellus kitauei]